MSRARDLGSLINSTFAGKNIVINGGMDIAQRGTSLTGVNGYSLDRWLVNGFGTSANIAVNQNLVSGLIPGLRYFMRITPTTSNTQNFWISQSLETHEVIRIAGRQVTLSFYYRMPSAFTGTWSTAVAWSTGIDANLHFPASSTSIFAENLSGTGFWQRYTRTFTVPANATSLAIQLQTTNNVLSTAMFDLTGVQLEIGSSATEFSRAGGDIEGELAKCQRYYQRWNFTSPGDHLGNGQASGSSSVRRVNWPTKVIMRSNPSIPTHTGTIVCYKADGSGVNLTSLGYNGSTPDRISVDFGTSASAGTAGDYIFVLLNSGAYFEASAEL